MINFLLCWSITLLMFIQRLHSSQPAGRTSDFGNLLAVSLKTHACFNCPEYWMSAICIVWFQKISIHPRPQRWFFQLDPQPHPLGISIPGGSCVTPSHPSGISYFPFHGLNLPYLEIINTRQIFIIFLQSNFHNLWPMCNLLQGNMYFLCTWSTVDRLQAVSLFY